MSVLSELRVKAAKAWPFQTLPPMDWSTQAPTYADANPAVIRSALTRAQRRPSGNWYAFAASSQVGAQRPRPGVPRWRGCRSWRGEAPTGACWWPRVPVRIWARTCPPRPSNAGRWCARGTVCGCRTAVTVRGSRSRPTTMACCAGCGWTPSAARPRPTRRSRRRGRGLPGWRRCPASKVSVSLAMSLPTDWTRGTAHGSTRTRSPDSRSSAHLPPTTSLPDELDRFLVAVTFQIGRLGVPVIAEFTAPGPRTVVMRIIDGEGQGSVVETHATPMGAGRDGLPRTAVVEAVIAHSDRPHFGKALVGCPGDQIPDGAIGDAAVA